MSTRFKVVGATVVLAVLIGGSAWAATSNGSRSFTPRGAAMARLAANAPAQPGAPGTTAGPRWRDRVEHMTNAQVNFFYNGETYALTIQHGILTQVGSDALTLKELDGRSLTVPVNGQTRVRLNHQWSSLDKLEV